MPLPPTLSREELHVRRIELRGFRRHDGLFEIDGRVVDTRNRGVGPGHGTLRAPGERVHDMWVRLIVDSDLVVRDLVAASDAYPYAACAEAASAMRSVVGERIRHGWTAMVKERLGGARGCTHLMELLMPLATVAYQTLAAAGILGSDQLDEDGRPVRIDSCYAYASHRDVVRARWPRYFRPTPGEPS